MSTCVVPLVQDGMSSIPAADPAGCPRNANQSVHVNYLKKFYVLENLKN